MKANLSTKKLFGVTALLLTVFTWLATVKAQTKGEVSFQEVKVMAQEFVNSDSALIKAPIFRYTEQNKQIEYYLGGGKVQALELQSGDPFLLPIEKQIQKESLEKLFSQALSKETFWQPILAELEQLVRLALSDIENLHDRKELERQLDGRSTDFDNAMGKLDAAIRSFAKAKGYTPRKVGRGLASDTFSVPIVKNPGNGRVQVLPWVKYVLCNRLQKCGANWPWRELVSTEESMVGEYYYEASWPRGRRSEGKIDIRSNATITFTPRD